MDERNQFPGYPFVLLAIRKEEMMFKKILHFVVLLIGLNLVFEEILNLFDIIYAFKIDLRELNGTKPLFILL